MESVCVCICVQKTRATVKERYTKKLLSRHLMQPQNQKNPTWFVTSRTYHVFNTCTYALVRCSCSVCMIYVLTNIRSDVYVRLRVRMHVSMSVSKSAYMYVYLYGCMYACMNLGIYLCMCACRYSCMIDIYA